MSAHTPGPWEIEKEGDGASIVNREHDGDDWCIAEVYDAKNAPVIAAAPDLLAALQELVRYAPGKWVDDERPQDEIDAGESAAFAQAEAAIAKATQP